MNRLFYVDTPVLGIPIYSLNYALFSAVLLFKSLHLWRSGHGLLPRTPNGIIDLHLSSNKRTALRLYRKHIAQNPDDLPKNNSVPQPAQALDNNPDRKKHKSNSVRKAPEISFAREDILEDPDWQYKPILQGAFSTRPRDADGGKIGAECGEL